MRGEGAQYWSKTCEAALAEEGTKRNEDLLLGTHGFTVACFIISGAVSGYWLFRWSFVRRSNPELLARGWRWLGPFLGLSLSCCIFGIAAWVAKINLTSYNIQLALIASSITNTSGPPCRRTITLARLANQSQSAYRIAYAVEFASLFLSMLLALDRIGEHARSAKMLSRRHTPRPPENGAPPHAGEFSAKGRALTDARLLPSSETSSSPVDQQPAPPPKFNNLYTMQLLFRAGIVLVAACSLVPLAAVVTTASLQANTVATYHRAHGACPSDDVFTDDVILLLSSDAFDKKPLLLSIFTGHTSEFVAGILVIVLYAAVGAMGASIVSTARSKIEQSLANLDVVHARISSNLEARAAAAVANALNEAMKVANTKMQRLAVFYCTMILFFAPRAAYTGLLSYASSEAATECNASLCDACEPVPALIYQWTILTQENNAILAAFSSAMLVLLSVWFILTADEKQLLRTGVAVQVEISLGNKVETALHNQIGLDQVL